jgi:hypothetical protein
MPASTACQKHVDASSVNSFSRWTTSAGGFPFVSFVCFVVIFNRVASERVTTKYTKTIQQMQVRLSSLPRAQIRRPPQQTNHPAPDGFERDLLPFPVRASAWKADVNFLYRLSASFAIPGLTAATSSASRFASTRSRQTPSAKPKTAPISSRPMSSS